MCRSNNGEVTPVDRGDVAHAETLCCGHDRRVDRAEGQVTVARDQFCDAQPVCDRYRLHDEGAAGEVAQKADLWIGPESGGEQVDDFGDDERGNDERAGVSFEQLERGGVVGVVGVDVGVERPGIDDESGYRPTSAARISSIRPEMSWRPLWPAPAAPRARRPEVFPR